ncbi:NAD(P)/FAD-dependent oxidoreductase [Mesonia aestuariivivens]|uniref:NAD(P)/FAD-dependent oxidoreductase n=1 Tax=Mesonia aestuariivivens TaxID=2796128 RepID=A0ABS6W558_9FLAO|nr:NAD(P)/FAD-dependent oxidoreductase [Mesonia aestuariivivens]MBW2963010.1 NAD(P)/FAD-dependent oxidoreductase [Mesonia aestuariivivens]
MNKKEFEVIIIGGSYAGLSAAMALGRSLRSVLIIDSGKPSNSTTPQAHNFITQDGVKPSAIAKKAKEQVLNYPSIKFIDDLAVEGKKTTYGFEILTQKNILVQAKKLIFATGIKDIMPNIKGFSACWGISVIHCPYCHGYEFKGQKTGIIANGNRAVHVASLVNNLTATISILTSGKNDFTIEQTEKLKKNNIEVIEAEISEIEHDNGYIKNVIFKNGEKMNFAAVYAAIPFEQHSEIPISLGCELTEEGHIQVDNFQKTSMEGVFACGDNSTMMRSVAIAVANGSVAGAMVNMELIQENF